MDLVEKIYFLMELNDIKNPAKLAKIAGLPYTTVSGILNRTNVDLRLSSLQKFCKAFNISMTLLTDDNIDLKELFNDKNNLNELSKIKLASYLGLNLEGLNETDIQEIEEIIKLKQKLKEEKE